MDTDILKKTISIASLALLLVSFTQAESAKAPKFTGMPSCSSTSCHGGASDQKNQCLIWSKKDFHSRSYATLTSARSERLAEVLKIDDATKSPKCTVCHAPFQTVSQELLAKGIKITQGVSCENCHGAAEPWLLTHTRADLTHEDKIAAGMRDLRSLYGRANNCVACHQTLESDVAAAGHPELIFELDGQSVSQPKHWREQDNYSGAHAWFIGQVVALREMSWQLSREKNPDPKLIERWSGLFWVVNKAYSPPSSSSFVIFLRKTGSETNYAGMQEQMDQLAQLTFRTPWSKEMAENVFAILVATAPDFQNKEISKNVQARRAERLVLALDRLATHAKVRAEGGKQIDTLFALTQSLPDFDPNRFAVELEKLSATVLP